MNLISALILVGKFIFFIDNKLNKIIKTINLNVDKKNIIILCIVIMIMLL